MGFGQVDEGGADDLEAGLHLPDDTGDEQSDRGVDDVLAGQPPMQAA